MHGFTHALFVGLPAGDGLAAMNVIYDFWLGEPVAGATRYFKRHKRDGLCQGCQNKALEGHTYCQKHLEQHNSHARKYAAAMRAKKAVCNVNTTTP
jgi:hypothetical protein